MAENDVASPFEELVIQSLGRIEDQQVLLTERVDTISERVDSVGGRMDNLVETTNHRLDMFLEALAKKADKTELIVPVIGRFLDTWPKRFIAFSTGVLAASSVVAIWWDKIFEFVR